MADFVTIPCCGEYEPPSPPEDSVTLVLMRPMTAALLDKVMAEMKSGAFEMLCGGPTDDCAES